MEYAVDPDRLSLPLETGIFIRAKGADGAWGSFDIAHLSRGSLYAWLRSRENVDWPIDVVMVLLNHRPFGTRSSEIESTDSLNSTLEEDRRWRVACEIESKALNSTSEENRRWRAAYEVESKACLIALRACAVAETHIEELKSKLQEMERERDEQHVKKEVAQGGVHSLDTLLVNMRCRAEAAEKRAEGLLTVLRAAREMSRESQAFVLQGPRAWMRVELLLDTTIARDAETMKKEGAE